ncbi:MAG: 4-hydroxy-3-methylbut-2-enyl diphosphate reductase [Paludibacteraceae bacterium]|nr:4-hydroxy-3-methylbut-2-enyl diphosphate reductase [Paludibacteraceae bacterium]MBR6685845.1 4-hydroxy-3-methylbut-2-enyl diphosphate reductase [Paludibacteraceae bacterium]
MQSVIIEIDEDSGFCFGVVNAIKKAEEELDTVGSLYCLGDIVHNSDEVERLSKKGLKIIDHDDLSKLTDTKVLLRAHGEPPATYKLALSNNVEIVDATCPVVLALQKRILKAWTENPGAQIVIYGKKGHAEVNGLVGQTQGEAIVVENENEIDNIDFSKQIFLFSQTTKSLEGFKILVEKIKERMNEGVNFVYYDTICRQVANRMDNIRKFAREHDLVIFVSGKKSSNGKVLFEECKKQNSNTYFVSSADEVEMSMLSDKPRLIGICGATSTPKWQMQEVKDKLLTIINYV